MSTITVPQAQKIAAACFSGAKVVFAFMDNRIEPKIKEIIKHRARERLAEHTFLRALHWMRTVAKLDNPGDIQAIASGARSMLEIAIDLVYLKHDPTETTAVKIFEWERSNKLKQCESLVRFYTEEKKITVPKQFHSQVEYISKYKTEIEAIRLQYWPNAKDPAKGNVPERWTQLSLPDDARAVDKLDGLKLQEFYQANYRRLCWHVHGSGATGFRDMGEAGIIYMSGCSYRECSQLALLISRLALQIVADLWTKDRAIRPEYAAVIKKMDSFFVNSMKDLVDPMILT